MATNVKFKVDDYISLPVADGVKSGDPVVVGTLVGVAITDEGGGVGNQPGYASVALAGGVEVNLPNGVTFNIGDKVYLTPAGAVTATASGNTLLGKVTHTNGTGANGNPRVIVKIVQ